MAIKLDGALAHVVDAIADRFADRLLARIGAVPRNGAAGRTTTNGRRSSKLAGRKLDMRCRYWPTTHSKTERSDTSAGVSPQVQLLRVL
jgi:hypothetical protein